MWATNLVGGVRMNNEELKSCPSCEGEIRLHSHCGLDYLGCLAKCQKCNAEYKLKTKLVILKNSTKISKTVFRKATKEWNARKNKN